MRPISLFLPLRKEILQFVQLFIREIGNKDVDLDIQVPFLTRIQRRHTLFLKHLHRPRLGNVLFGNCHCSTI